MVRLFDVVSAVTQYCLFGDIQGIYDFLYNTCYIFASVRSVDDFDSQDNANWLRLVFDAMICDTLH